MENFFTCESGLYSVRYPQHWEVEEDEYCVTICDPQNGVGALQISTYRAPNPQNPGEVLFEYLSSHQITAEKAEIEVLNVGKKSMSTYDFVKNSSFKKLWFISHGRYLLFITYFCDAGNEDKESLIVREIVDSISILVKD